MLVWIIYFQDYIFVSKSLAAEILLSTNLLKYYLLPY